MCGPLDWEFSKETTAYFQHVTKCYVGVKTGDVSLAFYWHETSSSTKCFGNFLTSYFFLLKYNAVWFVVISQRQSC